ncbi:hypothetical protein A5717_26195 [Mycolicibacterium porcinum]|nr:hypothetical protein A5717_26195 [Mycolicibacterium porcinum]
MLALMACSGELPGLDAAIFADTGWEPPTVYRQVDLLEAEFNKVGVPLYRVSRGNLRHDSINPSHRFASVPYFVLNAPGTAKEHCTRCDGTGVVNGQACQRCREGQGRRQCTSEYKLGPIMRKCRELLGAEAPDFRRVPKGNRVIQWIGFSTDEIHRVNDRRENQYSEKRYPLLELDMSRKDCERYLKRVGWGHTAKSACIGCPFHGNAQWRNMRDTCDCGHHRDAHNVDGWCEYRLPPDAEYTDEHRCECPQFHSSQWADAVEFDRAIRKGGARGLPLNGEAFLHRSRVPLDQAPIDRVTAREWADRQTDIFDAIADLDAMEHGDEDGCSPYGCRSGEPVTTVELGLP